MSNPLAIIADALIEFILSLLRDPAAVAEFEADPEAALAAKGISMGGLSAADIRSVVPVIVDHPHVYPRAASYAASKPSVGQQSPAVREIQNVVNNFRSDNYVTVDNRSTIIDQSVNQNIWAEGDVTQSFDQVTNLAFGDGSVAAGNDGILTNTDTDVTIGDVAIGNTETNVDIDDSFNDQSTDVDVEADVTVSDSFNDQSTNVAIDADVIESFNSEVSLTNVTDISYADSYADTSYADSSYDESAAYVADSVAVEEIEDEMVFEQQ